MFNGTRPITNREDVIDSRGVIARIEHLRSYLDDADELVALDAVERNELTTLEALASEVHIVSSEKLPGDKRRRPNSGTHGAGDLWAATYDEWGWIIAELFKRDPSAIVGTYGGVADFNRRTSRTFTERQG